MKKVLLFLAPWLLWLGLFLSGAFGLIAAGGCGATGLDGEVIANAGADREVLLNAVVNLDGTGSVGVASALWTFDSRPSGSAATISGATTLTPSFIPDRPGEYILELTLNDGVASDTATVTALGALAAISVPPGSAITTRERFGATEYVVDLGKGGAALSAEPAPTAAYRWEQIAGPRATSVSGERSGTFVFTAPTLAGFLGPSDRYKWQPLRVSRNDTRMMFRLTVTVGGISSSATFIVYLQDDGEEIHTSSGLPNVGVGTRVYLSGPDLNAAGASATDPSRAEGSAITDWRWTLSSVPPGASAAFLDTGSATSSSRFPSFVPGVAGIYVVDFDSDTGDGSGTAIGTVAVPGTLTINAADFVGVGTIGGADPHTRQCATCHDGNPVGGLEDVVAEWNGTKHASVFEDALDIYKGLAPEPHLWEFHTVGYNKDANDGGFDDLASAEGFEYPPWGLDFPDFVAAYPLTARMANVQCESCHGPGEEHLGDPLRIGVSFAQFGICGQCHVQTEPWMNSGHNSTGVKHGRGAYQSTWPTRTACARCHTAKGFGGFIDGEEADASDETGAFPGVTCAGCHDPHDETNPFHLRQYGDVTMAIDGSTVAAGTGAVCYTCHDGNYANGEPDCDTDLNGVSSGNTVCDGPAQTADEYWRGGYHYASQAPMLEGKQALTDLNGDGISDFPTTASSFHSEPIAFNLAGVTGNAELPSENNKCVTCHMAQGPSSEEQGYLRLGGHSFKLRTDAGTGSLELLSACKICHPTLTPADGFNRPAADYDGDGVREGIQEEVRGLLVNLGALIRGLDVANIDQASGFLVNGGTLTEDTILWAGSKTSLPAGRDCTITPPDDGKDAYQPCNFADVRNGPGGRILPRAVWNYNSVVRDGSLGIHNTAYTIQVLQGTYKALRILMQGAPAATTYKTDFPNAALR